MTPITLDLPDEAVGALIRYSGTSGHDSVSEAAKALLMDHLTGLGLLDGPLSST